jgi:hypothetical protein
MSGAGGVSPDPGGAGVSAFRLAEQLVRNGIQVHVFRPEWVAHSPVTQPTSSADGIILKGARPQALSEAIRSVHWEQPFDVFHGFYLPMAWYCLPVAQKERPVLASIQGTDGMDPGRDQRSRLVLRNATWITSVSLTLADMPAGWPLARRMSRALSGPLEYSRIEVTR